MQLNLLQLPEDEFLREIGKMIAEEGRLGSVLYLMIMYNVPLFVLDRLWPQKHAQYFASPHFLSFCIAEDGWKGRIDNITSTSRPTPGPEGSKPGYNVSFTKSYVVGPKESTPEAESQVILVVSKSGEAFALNWIPRSAANQTWQLRTEAHTEFGQERFPYFHYRVTGTYKAAEDDVRIFEKAKYRRLGLEIPAREFTSLGYLAGSLVSHYEPLSPVIKEARGIILKARSAGKISKEAWSAAQSCVKHLSERADAKGWKIHPLWHKLGMYERK